MSEVAEPFCEALADYLTQRLETPIRFTDDEPFAYRRNMVMNQEADLAWICGVDYVTTMGTTDGDSPYTNSLYEPLVSACHADEVKPLYYSDMIVHADSAFHSFGNLRDSTWTYNEAESFSGYKIMEGYLAEVGEPGPFFGQKVKSGSHLNSMAMVAQGQADSAVIDSSVMQMKRITDPGLIAQLRVITRLGPYPMPPLVISKRCPPGLRSKLKSLLTTMHQHEAGQERLNSYQISHFAEVDDKYYDDIRVCLKSSQGILLSQCPEKDFPLSASL